VCMAPVSSSTAAPTRKWEYGAKAFRRAVRAAVISESIRYVTTEVGQAPWPAREPLVPRVAPDSSARHREEAEPGVGRGEHGGDVVPADRPYRGPGPLAKVWGSLSAHGVFRSRARAEAVCVLRRVGNPAPLGPLPPPCARVSPLTLFSACLRVSVVNIKHPPALVPEPSRIGAGSVRKQFACFGESGTLRLWGLRHLRALEFRS
jgi:hypothetical protein